MEKSAKISLIRFEDVPLRDKQRIYAFCYGNPMKIAEYINNVNKVQEGDDGFVFFQDIQKIIDKLPEEQKVKLDEAKNIYLDAKTWEVFDRGNPAFVKDIIKKVHPNFKENKNDTNGSVTLNIDMLVRAGEVSGEKVDDVIEKLEDKDESDQ